VICTAGDLIFTSATAESNVVGVVPRDLLQVRPGLELIDGFRPNSNPQRQLLV
jgi:hypothetical protein